MGSQANIGDQIRDAVQDAIDKQDYTALRQTVEQGINAATEAIGRGIASVQQAAQQNSEQTAQAVRQRASAPARQDARRQQQDAERRRRAAVAQQQHRQAAMARRQQQQALAQVGWRFAKGGSTKAAGIGMTIGGAILGLGFTGGALATLIGAAVASAGFVPVSVVMLACLGGSIGLLAAGVRKIAFADRFLAYRRLLGTRQACEVSELQRMTGQSRDAVVRDLKKMIAKGMFTQGHLDAAETQLMVTDEAFQQCLALERSQAEQEKVRRLTQADDAPARLSAEEEALLSKGGAYVARIRAINERIPDPEITAKIRQIETVVQKIFEYAREHPEVIGDLQRLMDYYLPTTVKLLDAYADLDAQPVQGSNIASAKREIEETLDTLSVAFERLLDSIFKDMTWDVSTDISVLHTVLAQEGLVEGAFEGKDTK